MDWNPLKWLISSAVDAVEESEMKSTTNSADLGIKDQSGHKSSTVENKSPASENSSKNGDSSETILEFPLKQSLLDQARVSKKNTGANSGEQAHKDFHRMNLIINDKVIHKDFVNQLYDKYGYLITVDNKSKNYRPFARRILEEMFEYAQATIPGNDILEELITNCNQAGHQALIYVESYHILAQYNLLQGNSDGRTLRIDCRDSGYVNIKCDSPIPISSFENIEQKICELDTSLEFTIKLHDDKVQYENGKVTFNVPEELKNYHANCKSLLVDINEHFADDDSIIESLTNKFSEGPKSFVVGQIEKSDIENSDDDLSSFVMVAKNPTITEATDITTKIHNDDDMSFVMSSKGDLLSNNFLSSFMILEGCTVTKMDTSRGI